MTYENKFEIIPAIDILNGKCVRLTLGKYDSAEKYSEDPLEIAKKWESLGAKRIHIVDLDGAKLGKQINKDIILKISKSIEIETQVGGGIRTHEAIKEYLESGINYVIIGTKAFQDADFLNKALSNFKERIILGLDLKNNKVALSGWNETIDINLNKLLENSNIKQVIYTDISRDGTLNGPNLNSIKDIATKLASEVIVSGGVASLCDIESILKIKSDDACNITGVIIGKSLYKEKIDFSSALKLAKKYKNIKENN